MACVTPDLKRLVAYSSLAQMGFITLGVVSGNKIAVAGAVLLMFNHGVITAGLFLLVGFVERRRGTTAVAALTGLQGPAPVLAGLFTVVMMASIGLPGLSGFVSEFLVLIGTFAAHAVVGAGRDPRRRAGRALPALGLPAGLPGPGRGRQRRPRPTRRAPSAGSWCRSSCWWWPSASSRSPALDRISPSVTHGYTATPPTAVAEVTAIHVPSIHYLAILPVLILFGAAVALLGASALTRAPLGAHRDDRGDAGRRGRRPRRGLLPVVRRRAPRRVDHDRPRHRPRRLQRGGRGGRRGEPGHGHAGRARLGRARARGRRRVPRAGALLGGRARS